MTDEEIVVGAAEKLAADLNSRIEEAMKQAQAACVKICDDEFREIHEAEDIPEQHRNAWEQCCTRIAMKIKALNFKVEPSATPPR